jgi:hypothetical protein
MSAVIHRLPRCDPDGAADQPGVLGEVFLPSDTNWYDRRADLTADGSVSLLTCGAKHSLRALGIRASRPLRDSRRVQQSRLPDVRRCGGKLTAHIIFPGGRRYRCIDIDVLQMPNRFDEISTNVVRCRAQQSLTQPYRPARQSRMP